MYAIRGLSVVLAAIAALSFGSANADGGKADPRAKQASASYGVIESIDAAPAGPAAKAPADGGAAAGQAAGTSAPVRQRFVIRVRLDDGRYQGFHQDGGEELRVGDRVQVEIDRLRRAQQPGKTGK